MTRDRIYPTTQPALRPRPQVGLQVWLSGVTVGLVLGFLLTTCYMAAR